MRVARARAAGFGLLELLIVVAIVAIVVVIIAANMGDPEEDIDDATAQSITAAWVAPASQMTAGTSKPFNFLVTVQSPGGSTLDATGRNVSFSVSPSDADPPQLTIDFASAQAGDSGITVVTVTANEDYVGPGTLTGTDTDSGEATAATFTVVPPE